MITLFLFTFHQLVDAWPKFANSHGCPQKLYQGGGKLDIFIILFSLLMMQCKCTFTKRFTLSTHHKEIAPCCGKNRKKYSSLAAVLFSLILFFTAYKKVSYCYGQSLSRCITCHRCLCSIFTCGKTPTAVPYCRTQCRQMVVSHLNLLNGIVAIGNPERHVRKASHRGSKQQ